MHKVLALSHPLSPRSSLILPLCLFNSLFWSPADESLRKWKESLGLKAGAGGSGDAAGDPRKVVILSLSMEVAGRDDVVIDLSSKEAIDALGSQTMVRTILFTIVYLLTFSPDHQGGSRVSAKVQVSRAK